MILFENKTFILIKAGKALTFTSIFVLQSTCRKNKQIMYFLLQKRREIKLKKHSIKSLGKGFI